MMKQLYTLFLAMSLLLLFSASVQAQILEGFETGLPTTAPTVETDVTLGSGTWSLMGGVRSTNHYAGTYGLRLSKNGYITTPVLSNVISISYYIKPSGASTATLQKSVNGGAYTTVGTQSISSGAYLMMTFPINDTSSNIRLRIINTTSNNHDVDQVSISTKATIPGMTVSAESLPWFGLIQAGSTSASASFTISGINLSQNLNVTPPAGFLVSKDNTTFAATLALTPVSGTVATTTVYVQFAPATASGLAKGDIMLESTGASSQVVSVSGTAIGTEPTAQSAIAISNVTGNTMSISFTGGNGKNRLLIAKANSAVDWTPADGIRYSGINSDFSVASDQGNGNVAVFAGSASNVTITGLAVGTKVYFASFEYNGDAASSENYLTTNPGTGSATTLEVAGLFATPTSLVFGNTVKLMVSAEKTYALSGAFLTPENGSITVTAPNGFEVSTTSGSGFGTSASVSYTNSKLSGTYVYVRFSPTAIAPFGGNITNVGGGASLNVAASGTGIDSSILFIKTYYVSPTGKDTNPGTIDATFYSVATAVALAQAGDTIYMRGGTYSYGTKVDLAQSGAAGKMICLLNYPGELPVLDFSTQPYGAANRAFLLTGDYWNIRGLEIMHAGDNAIKLEGNYNIIERCVLHHNGDTGIQLGFAHETENPNGAMCSNNLIHNCDSYMNFDPDSNGGDADGFACKMHNGKNNVFRGCRSWHNSDDGWDLFETDWSVYMDSCWTWHNGDKADFGGVAGNGNGFKLGGNGTGGNSKGIHYVTNCVAFNTAVRGFDQNSHQGGISIKSSLSFGNAYNFMFEKSSSSGVTNEVINCAEFGHKGAMAYEFDASFTLTNNTWTLSIPCSASDYQDITEAGAMAPREADGSLPHNGFAKLVSGSGLIDKGTNVGLPYAGSAPDIGPFEYGKIIVSVNDVQPKATSFALSQNYPNPFNPSTVINYQILTDNVVSLKVYDMLGKEVKTLVNEYKHAGSYSVTFDAHNLTSGIYLYELRAGSFVRMNKMILMK